MKQEDGLVMKNTEGKDVKIADIANIFGNQKLSYYQAKDSSTSAIKSLIDTADNMIQALLWYEQQLADANEKIKKLTAKKK